MVPLRVLWLSFVHSVFAFTVAIPCSPADNAPVISPSLVSLSIEQDRWPEWAGTASRNRYFLNTLENLRDITGAPPYIRIGANSEDKTNFNPNVEYAEDIFPLPTVIVPYPEATNITVGATYYHLAHHLPEGTHVIWGVNLGQNNLTAAVLEAQAIIGAFNSSSCKVQLDFIEIGNEADLYANNGDRAKNYSSSQYVQEWTTFATNISETVKLNEIETKFLLGAFAGSSYKPTGFSPQAIYAEGVLNSTAGSLVTAFSEHHYSGSFCAGQGGLLQDLMTKSTIRGNLTIYAGDVNATHAQNLDYILGETNSFACHGAPGVSNTAGAALWALDYLLFATQIGISQVFFHNGIGFKYNLIQPVTLHRSILDGSPMSPLAPHVQPAYYAAIIAAELRGDEDTVQITEIAVNNTRIAGYAAFEDGELARALFINSEAFLRGDTNRSSIHLDLDFSDDSDAPSSMTIKRLNIGYADDVSDLTWGNQTYGTDDGKVDGTLAVGSAPVVDGVDISATEVVLLEFC
ncbi:glycoside hydrolase family 79 protein [Mycena maculata]|uniref:Glycoside hydrolase family 79 protein n=1 Tax=Mycena maculata TaxID=230809 RepID=A0AAD7HQP1_9AGAR|nr:glycoside hydrolase family 79 protein [Mycena maculata]